jgi:N-acetylmuramoyl-L-alanine amidase
MRMRFPLLRRFERVRTGFRNRRFALRVFWYRLGTGARVALGAALAAALVVSWNAIAYLAQRGDRENLECLARNIYYEARGEPAAGQLAVGEVTMNRVRSGIYPSTVCEVVYQKNWDPLRRRWIGAFSWTEFDRVPVPRGHEWERAWVAAETVYYGRHAETLQGATLYHAARIRPSWARNRQPVARVGRHVFYR